MPASGVSAVVLNVTATQPTAPGHLTVYPDGVARPTTSSLNFSAGETIPNLVVAPVGADGKVDFYNGSIRNGPGHRRRIGVVQYDLTAAFRTEAQEDSGDRYGGGASVSGADTVGRRRDIRAPPPGSFSAWMVPPSAFTTWATMARPRPDPGSPRAAGER